MAVAMIHPEAEKGGRGKTVPLPDGLSKQRISEARAILKWAPELAQGVLSGLSLDDAYAEATMRKGRAETTETRLANLRLIAPSVEAGSKELARKGPLLQSVAGVSAAKAVAQFG